VEFKLIYNYLIEELKLKLDSKDNESNTPLLLAFTNKNFRFLDLALQSLTNMNKKQVADILKIEIK
jgi:ankyrin repeat protein